MKIAISLDEMSVTGGSKFALNLACFLKQNGHDVTIVTIKKGPWWGNLEANGLSSFSIQPSIASVKANAKRLARYWDNQAFDVIILNLDISNRIAQMSLYLVSKPTRVMIVLHGDWLSLYDLAEKHVSIWDCAVAVSPKVYEEAKKKFPNKPIYKIINGVIVSDLKALNRNEWKLPLEMIYVGRLIDEVKGILRLPLILAACKERKLSVKLTIVGIGEDQQRLKNSFITHGVFDMVTMLGPIKPEHTAELMRSHHLLLLPTNMEGMPLVVLEAQANGCPVVVTRLEGITDIAIEEGVTGGLVDLANDYVEVFVDQIEKMLDPVIWKSYNAASVERSTSLFSVDKMGEKYLQVISELLTDSIINSAYISKPKFASSFRFTFPDLIPHPIRLILGFVKRTIFSLFKYFHFETKPWLNGRA